MPTYEYECSACGHMFDIFQSMTEQRLSECPKCGKNKLNRLIGSGTGIIFKGNGFYETDYKRKAPSKEKTPQAPCSASDKKSSCDSCPHKKD